MYPTADPQTVGTHVEFATRLRELVDAPFPAVLEYQAVVLGRAAVDLPFDVADLIAWLCGERLPSVDELGHLTRIAGVPYPGRTAWAEALRRVSTSAPAPPAPDPSAQRTFLCHSNGDKQAVRDLYRRLQADSVRCWLDEEDLRPGQDWDREIRRTIKTCRFVVACLSSTSTTAAGYVQKELKFALDRSDEQPQGSIFLIPARLEPCEIPDRLGHLQAVDLFEKRGYDRLLDTLRHPTIRHAR